MIEDTLWDHPADELVLQREKISIRSDDRTLISTLILRCQLVADTANAAGDADGFTGNPMRVVGCQEHCSRCDIFPLAEAAKWCSGNQLLAEFAREIAIGRRCIRVTGQDRVHLDAARSEFTGQREGHRIDGPPGRGIDAGREIGGSAEDRADVDDAAAALAKKLESFPDRQEVADYIDTALSMTSKASQTGHSMPCSYETTLKI
ncbi:hypothetical protein MMA231_03556 (plasmid) [Asticcacaulis sp. MM231]